MERDTYIALHRATGAGWGLLLIETGLFTIFEVEITFINTVSFFVIPIGFGIIIWNLYRNNFK